MKTNAFDVFQSPTKTYLLLKSRKRRKLPQSDQKHLPKSWG